MANAPRILVNVYHLAHREAPYLQRLRDAGFELVFNRSGRQQTEDELIEAMPGAFASIPGFTRARVNPGNLGTRYNSLRCRPPSISASSSNFPAKP